MKRAIPLVYFLGSLTLFAAPVKNPHAAGLMPLPAVVSFDWTVVDGQFYVEVRNGTTKPFKLDAFFVEGCNVETIGLDAGFRPVYRTPFGVDIKRAPATIVTLAPGNFHRLRFRFATPPKIVKYVALVWAANECGTKLPRGGLQSSIHEARAKGLSDGQFAQALHNLSTAPNYVLVTVLDKNTGKRQAVCLDAMSLLAAIAREHDLKWKETTAFALKQPDRTFTFAKAEALKAVSRTYTDGMLQDARKLLAGMTAEQIEAATRDQKSTFYEFCARQPGAFSGRFAAVAHVLSGRGLLCVRGCKPGLFGIDKRTR